ncbi:MAG: hypothetical protein ACI8YO_000707 [Gammaproteobacteria bacterium]|jgi:hypothetical protein
MVNILTIFESTKKRVEGREISRISFEFLYCFENSHPPALLSVKYSPLKTKNMNTQINKGVRFFSWFFSWKGFH